MTASKERIPQAIVENKGIYPDEATMRKFFTVSAKEPDVQKIITREWSRVKLGR